MYLTYLRRDAGFWNSWLSFGSDRLSFWSIYEGIKFEMSQTRLQFRVSTNHVALFRSTFYYQGIGVQDRLAHLNFISVLKFGLKCLLLDIEHGANLSGSSAFLKNLGILMYPQSCMQKLGTVASRRSKSIHLQQVSQLAW